VSRRCPEWGQEVVCSSRFEAVADQGANLALAASRLGVSTEVIGNVGEDAAGTRICRELGEVGIGLEEVETTPGGSTPMTIAAVRPDGERAFLCDLGCLKNFDSTAMARHWSGACEAKVVALVGSSNLPSLD
jgi:ribokinase